MIGEIMNKKKIAVRAGVVTILAMGLMAPAQAADNPVKLVAPKEIADVPAIPFTGIKAQSFTTPSTMVNLEVTPSQVVIGNAITITGKGLTGNTPITLTWSTHDATWVADVQPNTVNYMGTSFIKYNVVIATITTDALGGFVYKTKVPSDFGGVHDIYAVNNDVALAHGGVQIARTFKMTPSSGPVGTPITIEYSGKTPLPCKRVSAERQKYALPTHRTRRIMAWHSGLTCAGLPRKPNCSHDCPARIPRRWSLR